MEKKIAVYMLNAAQYKKVLQKAYRGGKTWSKQVNKTMAEKWNEVMPYLALTYSKHNNFLARLDLEQIKGYKIITAEEYLNEEEVQDVSEFKVGDRVESLVDDNNVKKGMQGEVWLSSGAYVGNIGIRWDKHIYGHDCNGKCEDGHGYFMYATQIKLIDKGEETMSISINKTIRKVFAGDTFEQVELMQHYFGNEIQESFSGELFLTANKKKFEDEVLRLEAEREAKELARACKSAD